MIAGTLRRRLAMLAPAAVIGATLALAAPAAAPAAISAVPIGSFEAPMYVSGAPGDPQLLFVVERGGRVRVARNENFRSNPFLDISDIVLAANEDPGAGSEQGLLSIAFPGDYAETRRFYVYFTNNSGNVEIDEFRTSAANPLRANPNSRRRVIVVPHPPPDNHNGGQMHFAPNGRLLFFATGDGGAGERANAADLTNLLGKLVRIDPRRHGQDAYRVPASNPYVGAFGRDEIYAYGLRNPWRWSFDGGRLTVADVGQTEFEEVNGLLRRDAAGVNFGWPEFEGFEPFDPAFPGPDPPTFPVFAYGHDETGGCAVTGGYIVRDPDLAALAGRYLYSDFCHGQLRSLRINFKAQTSRNDRFEGLTLPLITSFGEGAGGQLYAAQLGGQVSRLEPAS